MTCATTTAATTTTIPRPLHAYSHTLASRAPRGPAGKRVRKWSVNSEAYGEQWAPGDVIGVCIDLDAATISFHRNGVDMGVAFDAVRTMQPHLAYFPAVSLSHAERCELNFGAQPLQYPVAGYAPLQPPPPPAQLAVASYLTDGLQRLLRLSNQQAAAHGAALPGAAAGQQQQQQQQLEGQQQPGALAWHDTLILGAALLQRMQQLMVSEYFISSSLLQLLLSCHGGARPHRPDSVRQLLALAQLALEPRVFSKATAELLLQLSRRCKSAPLRPAELPYSGSFPYIALMNCLVQVPAVKVRLLGWLRNAVKCRHFCSISS
jgi:Kip1 ubiquitination-promoting complex protein 1